LCLPSFDKIVYASQLIGEFVHKFYGVPKEVREFYPLEGGGLPDEQYQHLRDCSIANLGIFKGDILFVHSGKQAA
jgi:hypothetical protein